MLRLQRINNCNSKWYITFNIKDELKYALKCLFLTCLGPYYEERR